ncbi:MAG: SDR family NAD(P)-dependent oxidoreductase [Alkalispirochaeta sp.]
MTGGQADRWSTIWITGASSGIGRALAVELATPGRRLVLSGRSEERLQAVADRCRGIGAETDGLPFEIADESARIEAIEAVRSQHGVPDMLINNAGVSQRATAVETRFDVDRRITEVNYLATVHLTKGFLPEMTARNSGTIVTVSSIAGLVAARLRSAYNAAKAAQIAFVRTMQNELYRSDVQIALVIPGFVRTEVSGNALRGEGGNHGVLDPNQASGMTAETAARRIVTALERRRPEIYVGVPPKAQVLLGLSRFVPGVATSILRKARV